MACNSVALLKTTITDQHLIDLLNNNKGQLVTRLKALEILKNASINDKPYGVAIQIGLDMYYVQDGKTMYRGYGQPAPGMLEAIEEAVTTTSTALFATEIADILDEIIVSASEEEMVEDGKRMLAAVFGVKTDLVEGRVVVLPNRQVQMFIDEGERDAAFLALDTIATFLKGSIPELEIIGQIESHRDTSMTHVHSARLTHEQH